MHYLLDHQILVLQYRDKYLDIEFYWGYIYYLFYLILQFIMTAAFL